MIDSLKIEQNPLFSKSCTTVSSISVDLDFKKVLQYGDHFINSPLLELVMDELENA